MNTEQFTPGPWEVEETVNRTGKGYWVTSQSGNVAHFNPLHWTQNEAESNAHLIAAAPDMYEALKDAREEIGRLRSLENLSFESPAMAKIDSALSKANGK